MTETYLEYANKVPKENRIAAENLSGQNDLRWAVLVAIVEDGASPFSRIKEILDVHQQRLSDALSALQQGGLIEKRVGDELGSKYSGEYAITNFGTEILDGFYQATSPKFEAPTGQVEFRDLPNYKGAIVQEYDTIEESQKSRVATNQHYDNGYISKEGVVEEVA